MESQASSTKVLPQGYTFIRAELFASDKANKIVDDLLEKAEKRNPDAFGLYIYNDYYSYAVHNLIESVLTDIWLKVIDQNWVDAFYAIEALTLFFEFESDWATADDSDLTKRANKLYGALFLSIIKGLEDANKLNTETFPNLESVLRGAWVFGDMMDSIDCKSPYATTCKAIANRLFKGTTAADQALYEARLREYAEGLQDPERKEAMLEDIADYLEEEEETWYLNGKLGSSEIKNASGGLKKAWNDYKGKAPPVPFRGPPEWDLTKWTDEEKRPFSLGNRRNKFRSGFE